MFDATTRQGRVGLTRRSLLRGGLVAAGGLLLPDRPAWTQVVACPGQCCPFKQLTEGDPPYWYLCRNCSDGTVEHTPYGVEVPGTSCYVPSDCRDCVPSRRFPVLVAPTKQLPPAARGTGQGDHRLGARGTPSLPPYGTNADLTTGTEFVWGHGDAAGRNFWFPHGCFSARFYRIFLIAVDLGGGPPLEYGIGFETAGPTFGSASAPPRFKPLGEQLDAHLYRVSFTECVCGQWVTRTFKVTTHSAFLY